MMSDLGLLALVEAAKQPPLNAPPVPSQTKQQPATVQTYGSVTSPEIERVPEFSQAANPEKSKVTVTAPEVERVPEFSQTPSSEVLNVTTDLVTDLTSSSIEGIGHSDSSNSPEISINTVTELANESSELEASDGMEQVTSVSQLSDVRPTDWAFQALQSLVERYGCIAGYPGREALPQEGRTFRGNRALTRYEFAAGLNACLDRVNELIAAATADLVKKEDLITLQKLQEEFAAEIASLKGRVDTLEARTTTLEKQQFSTTTRLFGQAIVSVQGSNGIDVDLFPRDGVPERRGKADWTLTNNVQISLATSFRGNDLLLTSLETGNLRSTAPNLFTNMGRIAYESEQDNRLMVSDLSYRFPLGNNFGVLIGAAGVNPSNTFRGINPLEGSGDGALSLFGQRNPILAIGNGTGGVGFDWQISDRFSLQAVYSAELPSFAGNSDFGGLMGGRYVAGTQLSIAPTDTLDLGIHYLFSRSPDGLLGTGVGDAQLLSPFAPTNVAFHTHAVGATLAWRLNSKWTIGGWGGWATSKAREVSGSVQTTNWMIFSAFPDLFKPGNLGGILFGQPPKITSSNLPDGYNFPRFSDTGAAGGQPDTAYHLEVFYRARVTNFIDLTPGVLVIFNPNHNSANDTLVIGALRATFRF